MQIQKWERLFWFQWSIKVVFPFVKNFFGQMTIFRKKHLVKWLFFEKKDSVKWSFGQMTIFQKRFQSNELSVICYLGHLTSFSSYIFGQMTIFQIFSFKRPFDKFGFGQMTFFGKTIFRLNGVRLNGDSVKCTFG
jgi:hypothetical protein